MINYLIVLNTSLVLLYGVYALILKRETGFRFSRWYLLFAICASTIIPLLDTTFVAKKLDENNVRIGGESISLGLIEQVGEITTLGGGSFWVVLQGIYWAGLSFFIMKILLGLHKLQKIRRQAHLISGEGGNYFEVPYPLPSFSFFKMVFIGNCDWHSQADKQMILAHEQAHGRLWHSADMVLLQLLQVVVWFNPIIFFYKKSFEEIHEFEADALVTQNSTARDYCELLARETLATNRIILANHFNASLTLKRINMITSMKKKVPILRVCGLFASTLLIVTLVACQDEMMKEIRNAAGKSVLLREYPSDVKSSIDELKSKNPEANIKVYGIVKGHLENMNMAKFKEGISIIFTENNPDYDAFFITSDKQLKSVYEAVSFEKNGEKVYTVLEEPASPKEGMKNLYDYIYAQIKYPSIAKEQNIEGRVFVQFMIDKTGRPSDFQIIRGIGAGCDEEALRALKTMPDWNPGKQNGEPVNSIFNLAIVFKIHA